MSDLPICAACAAAEAVAVDAVAYSNAGDATFGEAPRDPHPLDLVTICTIETAEGTFIGKHRAEPGAYDQTVGEAAALADATAQLRRVVHLRHVVPRSSEDGDLEEPESAIA